MQSKPVFDRSVLLENLGGDTELLQQIISIFIVHYQRDLQKLDEAIAAQDMVALARQAHSIKGVVGNFMAHDALECARALETASHAGMTENLRTLAAELNQEVNKLASALQRELPNA